ncbi:MAG: alpha-galactosidase [Lachnospiraceae bacterium]|nr:alpha-galactosidase [Lachnospiraceae bacterium]
MIERIGDVFALHTNTTSYLFRKTETGHLEHLYYGKKIRIKGDGEKTGAESLYEKHAFAPGNTNLYDQEHPQFSPEDMNLEISSYGKGDIREPFVEIVHGDGGFTCDFLFKEAEILPERKTMKTMPESQDTKEHEEAGEKTGGKARQLLVTLEDKQYGLILELYYTVYAWCDVITRRSVLRNESGEAVSVRRLMSSQLDFDRSGYMMTTFTGAWTREMNRNDIPLRAGKYVNASFTGSSSSRANPFVMLYEYGTTEDTGCAYGLNLVYSGNHYEAAEVSPHGKTRIVWGMNPTAFAWELSPKEELESPEAVMTFSAKGFNGMSNHMHDFVSEHIVRGKWQKKERPILLNSWEASYFDINEHKLLKLAKMAKQVGIELFVMDDGWFAGRNDDTSSLGDWEADKNKLPGGVKGIADKINALGLDFGIWVEPEMVNVKSKLYETHPDWALQIPGKPHSEGRNQRVLDLTRKEVQDYVIESIKKVLGSANISYVKWDMNRIMSDVFSEALPAARQGEVFHRYILGFYRCVSEITGAFPEILFEGCAAGGNRFDLGMLCYFPQIWGSDDTDAICRAAIQTGYSYGYPPLCVSAHVSAVPNHQTLRSTPLLTRFAVAAFGSFGYECNLCDLSKEELSEIEGQIALYKQWRSLFTGGRFYRGRSFSASSMVRTDAGTGLQFSNAYDSGNVTEWTMVSRDKKQAVGMLLQKLVTPNTQYQYVKFRGLEEESLYRFTGLPLKHNIKLFGDLVNTVSPVHVKQNSLTHDLLAKFMKMDGETEDYICYGDSLMHAGVKLAQGFSGTGYSDQVRLFQDFSARLYYLERME